MRLFSELILFISMSVFSVASFAGVPVQIQDLPQAVIEAVDAEFPGAEFLKAELEEDDGVFEYEVEICFDGIQYELDVTPDGFITDVDEEGACF